MKLCFLTDSHFKSASPKLRTDPDYLDTIMYKLEQIKTLVHERKVDVLLHGGDFFDTPFPDHKTLTYISSFFENLGVPTYVTVGNHDVVGRNLESLDRSGLGVLAAAGCVKLLPLDNSPVEFGNVSIKGLHYTDDDSVLDKFCFEGDKFGIIVAHLPIVPMDHEVPFKVYHPKNINTNAKLCISGHYHFPFKYLTWNGDGTHLNDNFLNLGAGGTFWVNPSALMRTSVATGDLERTPSVVFIDTVTETLEIIPLVVQPAEHVFDLELVRQVKEEKAVRKDLQEAVAKCVVKVDDLYSSILQLGQDIGVEQEVMDEAKNRISAAVEELK